MTLNGVVNVCAGLAHVCCHLHVTETLLSLQKKLVLQAVELDQAGEWAAALSHYCSALEHFVPAIHCKSNKHSLPVRTFIHQLCSSTMNPSFSCLSADETERQRKDALRQKVSAGAPPPPPRGLGSVHRESLREVFLQVSQYVSRAEELKALLASDHRLSFEEARTYTGVLRGKAELVRRQELVSCWLGFNRRCH